MSGEGARGNRAPKNRPLKEGGSRGKHRVPRGSEALRSVLGQSPRTRREKQGASDAHSAASSGAPLPPARAWRPASAACETSSERAQTTAATSSSEGATTTTRSRFRNDFEIASSSSPTTTTSGSG